MSALISIFFDIKRNYTVALDQRDYADDCGSVVMWPGRTNELLLKAVNLGVSSCAKAYFVMDEKTGEKYFFLSLNYMWDMTIWEKFYIYGLCVDNRGLIISLFCLLF